MRIDQQRADAISSAIWLIGVGILFATGYWWPGIMFVVSIASVVQGLVAGRGWYALQGGLWTFAIGIWAAFNYNLAVMLVFLGISMLLGAFVRPPIMPSKPHVDTTLE